MHHPIGLTNYPTTGRVTPRRRWTAKMPGNHSPKRDGNNLASEECSASLALPTLPPDSEHDPSDMREIVVSDP